MSAAMKPAPSIGLAFIAGTLKNDGHQVQIIDSLAEGAECYYHYKDGILSNGLSIEDIAEAVHPQTQIIGLSLMFSGNWIHNRDLIDYLGERFPLVTIIAGGEHLTSCPEFCIRQTKSLDVCVLGEGEETISLLLKALQNQEPLETVEGIVFRTNINETQRTAPRKRMRELESIPRPAWEFFPLNKYRDNSIIFGIDRGVISLPLLATRGCPYTCTFCSSPQMWGTRYFMRTPQDVADEIEEFQKKYDAQNFDFYDLTAIIRKEWIIEFCKEVLNRNLNITWQIPAGTRSEAIDQEVSYYLYKAGCKNITYAPESGSPETLQIIKKKVNLDNMLKSIANSSKEGMNIKINFIIGFPNETHKNIWQSLGFLVKASRAGVDDMAPSIFSPYPGSQLFEELKAQGIINMDDDSYFLEIINVDTFFENKFYNTHINKYLLRIYLFLYLFVFYSTNYFFHPKRFVRTIKNLWNKKYESRGEMAVGELLKRRKIKVIHTSPPIAITAA